MLALGDSKIQNCNELQKCQTPVTLVSSVSEASKLFWYLAKAGK